MTHPDPSPPHPPSLEDLLQSAPVRPHPRSSLRPASGCRDASSPLPAPARVGWQQPAHGATPPPHPPLGTDGASPVEPATGTAMASLLPATDRTAWSMMVHVYVSCTCTDAHARHRRASPPRSPPRVPPPCASGRRPCRTETLRCRNRARTPHRSSSAAPPPHQRASPARPVPWGDPPRPWRRPPRRPRRGARAWLRSPGRQRRGAGPTGGAWHREPPVCAGTGDGGPGPRTASPLRAAPHPSRVYLCGDATAACSPCDRGRAGQRP